MNRMSGFGSPLLLGFEEIERMVDRISRANGDGYPPYNIEKLPSEGGTVLRITLAVAGFTEDDLDLSVENNQLTVTGRQQAEEGRVYLHRGIAARQFRKSFVLAEGIEVREANLANGLLSIELIRPETKPAVRKIRIGRPGEGDGAR